MQCPTCEGRGYVLSMNSFDYDSDGAEYMYCPRCHGDKVIEDVQQADRR
jgi:DnaJ-class molecular chaperone